VRGRRGAVRTLVAAIVALGLVAAGCETRSQDAPSAGAPGADLEITAGYGAESLLSTRVAPGDSVMRALRGATEVDTLYGGGFVSAMLGRASDPGATLDWFFFVDGVSSPVGAREVTVRDGDDIWWDHRDWGALIDTPAVVGAWPAPFARPAGGGPEVQADPPLATALAGAGARVVDDPSPWRALVGGSERLAGHSPAWRRALADPDAAGLTVAIEGGRVTALAPGAGGRVTVPGARALAAAVPTGADPADGVTLVVAGLDAAAAAAAAQTIAARPQVLDRRYALAFDEAGRPLRAGGRTGP
jgi:hypothetical protein